MKTKMKLDISKLLKNSIIALFCMSLSLTCFAQVVFEHKATTSNTKGHITTINHTATDGQAKKTLFVSQVYGVYNDNEIGVWYNGKNWTIFNENKKPMPKDARFNVLVVDASNPNVFVHETSASNTSGHITTINHSKTNGKSNAIVLCNQNYGKYNINPVGVWYSSGKWKIFNENKVALPIGTQFNVLVLNEGDLTGLGTLNGETFKHQTSTANLNKHITTLNHKSTNNQSTDRVFYTQVWEKVYNPNVTGVWYNRDKWTVFNQNRKNMPVNQKFNVLAINGGSTTGRMISTFDAVAIDKVIIPTETATNKTTSKDTKGKISRKPSRNKFITENYIKDNPKKLNVVPYYSAVLLNPSTPNKPAEEETDEMKGPDMKKVKDLSMILTDAQYEPLISNLNIFREVYEDKNPKCGYLYYLPSNYSLQWNKDNGVYSFYLYYLSADDDGRGDVIITAELKPNVNRKDIELAEKILKKQLNKEVQLVPMLLKSTPKISFGNSLANFNVENESVTTNVPTDFLQPIIVSWKMGSRVDDLIGAMMHNIGISGNVEFEPFTEDEKKILIPIRLKINDAQTFGKLEFESSSKLLNGFYNSMDYPITLSQLNILREKATNQYTVESHELGGYQVDPQKIFAEFSNTERNAILSGDLISKMWIDYSLNPCGGCDNEVKDKILGGTSDSHIKEIEIQILGPLAYAEAHSMKIFIKSAQGDPKGDSEVILPMIDVDEDNITLKGGELFIPQETDPAYEYQLVLIHENGEVLTSDWIKTSSLFIVIGENSIIEQFEGESSEEEE